MNIGVFSFENWSFTCGNSVSTGISVIGCIWEGIEQAFDAVIFNIFNDSSLVVNDQNSNLEDWLWIEIESGLIVEAKAQVILILEYKIVKQWWYTS